MHRLYYSNLFSAHTKLTTTRIYICSKADEDLDLPGDGVVVGLDVNNVEAAVDEVSGWKKLPTSLSEVWK